MPSNVPLMRALMDDPVFKAYMKKVPPRYGVNTGEPWRLWVETGDHKWRTKAVPTYPESWALFVKYFRSDNYRDVTITSRRVFYAPPGEWYRVKVKLDRPRVSSSTGEVTTHRVEDRWRQTFFWDGADLHWCGRCRRPSYWMPLHTGHHALRSLPAVATEDNVRCIICGIRWITTPSIDQMVKVERKPQ